MTTTTVQADEFNQVISGDIFLNRDLLTYDEDGNLIAQALASTTRLTRDGIGILNNLLNGVDLTGIVFNNIGFAYQSLTELKQITWENLSVKIAAIQALSQASNPTTLNVNNTLQVQFGETVDPPTQFVTLSSDAVGNRLGLNGDYGSVGQVLLSGGASGSLAWGSGGSGSVGSLAEVLDVGAVANQTIDMDGNDLQNVGELQFLADPETLPILSSTGTSLKIKMNNVDYYVQLFTVPP